MRLEQSTREQPRDLILAEAVSGLEDMADRIFRQVHRFRIAEHSARADAGRIVMAADREQTVLGDLRERRAETKKREEDAKTAAASPTISEADGKRYAAMAQVYANDGAELEAEMKRLEEAIAEKERIYNNLLNTARKCDLAALAAEAELYL